MALFWENVLISIFFFFFFFYLLLLSSFSDIDSVLLFISCSTISTGSSVFWTILFLSIVLRQKVCENRWKIVGFLYLFRFLYEIFRFIYWIQFDRKWFTRTNSIDRDNGCIENKNKHWIHKFNRSGGLDEDLRTNNTKNLNHNASTKTAKRDTTTMYIDKRQTLTEKIIVG